MFTIFKKLKGNIQTIFVLLCILSLGAFVQSTDDTEVSKFVALWFFGIIGLCFVIWFRPIGQFTRQVNSKWPILKPVYEKETLILGIIILTISICGILTMLFN
jgi:hypothetical protein